MDYNKSLLLTLGFRGRSDSLPVNRQANYFVEAVLSYGGILILDTCLRRYDPRTKSTKRGGRAYLVRGRQRGGFEKKAKKSWKKCWVSLKLAEL